MHECIGARLHRLIINSIDFPLFIYTQPEAAKNGKIFLGVSPLAVSKTVVFKRQI